MTVNSSLNLMIDKLQALKETKSPLSQNDRDMLNKINEVYAHFSKTTRDAKIKEFIDFTVTSGNVSIIAYDLDGVTQSLNINVNTHGGLINASLRLPTGLVSLDNILYTFAPAIHEEFMTRLCDIIDAKYPLDETLSDDQIPEDTPVVDISENQYDPTKPIGGIWGGGIVTKEMEEKELEKTTVDSTTVSLQEPTVTGTLANTQYKEMETALSQDTQPVSTDFVVDDPENKPQIIDAKAMRESIEKQKQEALNQKKKLRIEDMVGFASTLIPLYQYAFDYFKNKEALEGNITSLVVDCYSSLSHDERIKDNGVATDKELSILIIELALNAVTDEILYLREANQKLVNFNPVVTEEDEYPKNLTNKFSNDMDAFVYIHLLLDPYYNLVTDGIIGKDNLDQTRELAIAIRDYARTRDIFKISVEITDFANAIKTIFGIFFTKNLSPKFAYTAMDTPEFHVNEATWVLDHVFFKKWLSTDHGFKSVQLKPTSAIATVIDDMNTSVAPSLLSPQIHEGLTRFFTEVTSSEFLGGVYNDNTISFRPEGDTDVLIANNNNQWHYRILIAKDRSFACIIFKDKAYVINLLNGLIAGSVYITLSDCYILAQWLIAIDK